MPRIAAVLVLLLAVACGGGAREGTVEPPSARHLLLITIDTLRPDRLGAYGDTAARTPSIDALAARGTRFTNAFAVTPITLPSHASILTGRYPPGHGARHNGMRLDASVPTLAATLGEAGFATGAFVGAFPLDRRFGLDRGFATYGDRMPRGEDGRLANERPGQAVVDEALAWLQSRGDARVFLWVHLFEPHAPYGDARTGAPVASRYADDVTEADRQVGRLVEALGPRIADTLIAVVADHGEAFGEHGEIAHSIFVYDTTLRVPMVLAGPGIPRRTVEAPVSQVDLAGTLLRMVGVRPFDSDGIDLAPLLTGGAAGDRTLYAESFAPLLDFGWSPLRSVRSGGWKYIAAPEPELFDLGDDPGELRNRLAEHRTRAAELQVQVDRFSGSELAARSQADPESAARLQALGYTSGARQSSGRPDPKARRELAARIAQVTSGELHGAALERQLRLILAEDPGNPLANLRLGYLLVETGRCRDAVPHFEAAIAAKYPSADPHLGVAGCHASARDFRSAITVLREAARVEPGNPVVLGNLGMMLSDAGDPSSAVAPLREALALDPDLHQARFGLAIALAQQGLRTEAAAEANELLRRLPAGAPQRSEVERLLSAVR